MTALQQKGEKLLVLEATEMVPAACNKESKTVLTDGMRSKEDTDEKDDYRPDYYRVEHVQMHRTRRREILIKHPEIQELQKPYHLSAIYTIVLGGGLTVLAYILRDEPVWVNFLLGYTLGAIMDHALWVLIHDYTHDAVFASRAMNKLFLIIADLVHLWPGGISFRHFHRMHHGHLNETYADPDLPSPLEDKIFGQSALGKAIWLFFFPFIQSLRMGRYGMTAFFDPWFHLNIAMNLAYVVGVLWILGWMPFFFLFVSTLFSIGLHPLGARWVAEHYSFHPDQETFSYYGSANLISFNIGYHNEHHDFPRIPWNRLPTVKALAREYYDNLRTHSSYFRVLYEFIFNSNFTLRSRVVRWPPKPVNFSKYN
jgi:sphingolipid delta-4 desaturase